MTTPFTLPEPAQFFPFRSGKYDVGANLKRLGFDFGNAEQDQRVFQIDRQWPVYIDEKNRSRREAFAKYVCFDRFDDKLQRAVHRWFIDRLTSEYPQLFRILPREQGEKELHCELSKQTLHFDVDNAWLGGDTSFHNGFDALCMQAQEDIAVVKVFDDGSDALVAAHLCLPNHWAAQDKIGRSFLRIHEPVADFVKVAQHAAPLMKNMLQAGSYVRFAWGVATDNELNHHPVPPPSHPHRPLWHGRRFDPRHPSAFVRVERQTLTGLPEESAFVFTIRTYFLDIANLTALDRHALVEAIVSMSPAVLSYKGLAAYQTDLISWLRSMT